MRIIMLIFFMVSLPISVLADERLVRLYAPEALIDTGMMRHILPRFTLKTQVRVELAAAPEQADMVWGEEGSALFQQADTVWHMALVGGPHAGTSRFADWLSGEIGQRTILGFVPDGEALFTAPLQVAKTAEALVFDGNAVAGHDVAAMKCGRCHAVDDAGRLNDIGSTPSFFVLKVFDDWEDRFLAFYVLRPHGSFTQINEVTDPFPQNLPPPITPVEMTLAELDDIVAYVATLKAADLGAPLIHQ